MPLRRQRFRPLSTSMPDMDGNQRFDLPYNCLSLFDPIDELGDKEITELEESIKTKLSEQ